jgi:subtilisin family serine protease
MTRTRQLLCGALVVLLCMLGAPYAVAETVPEPPGRIVVKVDIRGGHTIASVTESLPVEVVSTVLASRGIYLVSSTRPDYDGDGHAGDAEDDQKLVRDIAARPGAVWAELDQRVVLTDSRFHSWPYGMPGTTTKTDPAVFYGQRAAIRLNLAEAHARSKGAGILVAVLDTGADTAHPVLAGQTVPAWNYVDDTPDVSDVAQGLDSDGDGLRDEAVGHGTFVSGLVALAAPRARILPARVLDSDGIGNTFVVAEAIVDAVNAGAQVINLSFGTSEQVESKVVEEALRVAAGSNVVVISAAGNTGSLVPQFPASAKSVFGVAALGSGSQLAYFTNWGPWVEVAAPGDQLVGPMPGGGYAVWSGSSMSSALVSGQAALLRAVEPQAGAENTLHNITATARRLPTIGVYYGSIDIPRSLDYALT